MQALAIFTVFTLPTGSFGKLVACAGVEDSNLLEDLMKKQLRFLFSLTALVLLLGVGATLSAQEDKQRPPDQQSSPGQASPSTRQPSDNNAQSQTPVGTAQTFTGTVVKSGDKFVLQDASGTSYDVDNQDALKPHEGKKVNIKGTMDPNGKLIHVQQ